MATAFGFVIAASHSGAGKTTTTAVILRALCHRGWKVQSFKIGPDFIDPGYHREITQRPSINLDSWMMGPAGMRRAYQRWSRDADINVVEAMGGLFDGTNGRMHGSAAQVAKTLGLPVIVVLDVWGMTGTTAAILDGLRGFDPRLRIAGCVLNRAGSQAHADMIVTALPKRLRGLVIGAIIDRADLRVPERHLGLVTAEENRDDARAQAQREAGAELDIARLTRAAAPAATRTAAPARPTRSRARARLTVARDAAFCFYYEENLRALREAGFDIAEFSPLTDSRLPEGTDMVYLGGGYPEAHAERLAVNIALAGQLRELAAAGMPVYAECGGMMYLARRLTGFDGQAHDMTGILPMDITMDAQYLAIAYVAASIRDAAPWGAGITVRGQEFHQSRITHTDMEPNLFEVSTSTGAQYRAGFATGNVMASYLHLYLATRPALSRQLVRSAQSWRQSAT